MERKEINENYIELIDKFRAKLKTTSDSEERKELKLSIKEIKKEQSNYNKEDKDNKKRLGSTILVGLALTVFSVGISMSNEANSVLGDFLLHAFPAFVGGICSAKTVKELLTYVSRQNKNNAIGEAFINEYNEMLDEENENVRTR